MALGQPICLETKHSAKRREDYIYIWTETYIIGFLYICRKHITISPYDHTHAQPRTHVHTHIYMYTNMHNMNTAYIHHHNITYQNIIWRIITSRYMQQDQYIYVCIHLHYYHPTSHHTKIISPHAHIHIRITSACTSHILQTACYTRYTYRLHTTKVTHLYMHIHTYTQTHRPSPLHHSHTSSSLVAFLCSV